MKTIVKYSNRKLYDKETAKYTTLREIVKLPIGTFKVERYGTGEDVTTDTLLTALTSEKVGSEIKVQVMKHCITELELGVDF
jgi:polyhydroxyalkanoate synthesis regulator protein